LQSEISGLPNLALFPTNAAFNINTTITTAVLAIVPPNLSIALGTGSGLVLTQTNLNDITASTLVLGNTNWIETISVGSVITLPSTITNLTLASGDPGPFTGITISAALSDSNANGNITLQSNILSLAATVKETGSGGTVTILPAGTTNLSGGTETMGLGSGTGAILALSQAELNEITATTFVFGSATTSATMTVGGTVTVPGTITNLSLLTGNTLTVNNGATLADGNTNGTVTLQGSSLSLGGTVTVNGSGSTLVLNTTGSATEDPVNGQIDATNLLLLGAGGNYTLASASNDIGTLAASIGANGSISLYDSANLAIGAVDGINGVAAGTLNLAFANGDGVTQTQPIAVSDLSLSGNGGTYTLTNTSNSIGTFAASVGSSDTISLFDGSSLLVGSVNSINGVTAGTLNLSFASGAGVTQNQAIDVTNLSLSGNGGTYTLTDTSNSIGTFAASVGSSDTISLFDGSSLVVGSANSINGVTAGTLNLSFAIGAGVTQNQAIDVANLSLSGNGGTYTLTDTSNSIGTFAASVGSSDTISLFDGSNLVVGSVNSINGVTAGTLTLNDSGTVTQSQAISVTDLELLGSGATYTLTDSSNSVGTLAVNTGTVSLADGTSLTIGTVGLTTGVTATGNLTLNVTGTISDPTAPVTVDGIFTLAGGNWSQIETTLPTFFADDFRITGGTFLRVVNSSTVNIGKSTNPYSVADVYGLQGMIGFLSSDFSLANNINASGTAIWNGGAGFVPIGNNSLLYGGTFNGQNFVISNLTINQPNGNYVGLFGAIGFNTNSSTFGTVENVGLTNVSVTGNFDVGGLAGENSLGTITNTYVTGAVTGGNTSEQVGGLVGGNVGSGSFGSISTSYSTATVQGNFYVGGLVGMNQSASISQSYATGAVSSIGTSSQGGFGGLVGYIQSGSITNAYATGSVTVASRYGGGLIGIGGGGTITSTYTISYVSGGGSDLGAVVGEDNIGGSTFAKVGGSNSNYWDSNTAGVTKAAGVGNPSNITSDTTAMLQAALPSGFSNSIWGIIPNVSFPYFLWQYPAANGTPQVISGLAYTNYGVTALVNGIVTELVNGSGGLTTQTGGNGYYYFLLAPNTISSSGSQVLVYTTSGAAYQQNAIGSVGGLDIYGTYLNVTTPMPAYSDIIASSGLPTAIGSNLTVQTLVNGLANLEINPTASSFAIDQPISTGTLVLSTTGTVTQTDAIAVTNLDLLGSGGAYTLTGPTTGSNNVGSLVANVGTGTVNLNDGSNNLSIGTLNGTAGVTAGTLILSDTGTVTQSQKIAVTNLALLGSIATYTFTTSSNSVGTLAASVGTGAVSLTDSTSLAIGTVNSINGVTAGTLIVTDTGTVTQSQAISVTNLELLGSGATYTLTNSSNSVGTLAANAASIDFYDNAALTIGTVSGTAGVTATSTTGLPVEIVSLGNMTIANGASVTSGGAVLLAADGTFANNAGAGAVPPGAGAYFAIYSQDPNNPTTLLPANVFGGLTGTDWYNDAFSFTVGTFATTLPAGENLFVYGYAASLTPVLGNSAVMKVYDSTTTAPTSNLSLAVSGLLNANDSATLAVTGATYATANAGTNINVTVNGITFASNPNNYTLASATATAPIGTITPATLTYVANPATANYASPLPPLSGTVTGFVAGESLSSATSGTLIFSTTATPLSPVGFYPIDGSGLTANYGNYILVQAASNATALSIGSAAPNSSNPSHFNGPGSNNPPNPGVNITYQTPTNGPIFVSFTPGGRPGNFANNNSNDVSPGSLSPGDAFSHNNGFNYQPISQYDANQYSQFKLPGYQDQAGEATIFTIIARAISPDHSADYLIDTFWSGTAGDWNGANGNNPLAGKVTFSDGAGHDVAPTDANAFPIVAGTTDFSQLLKSGPVMIGDGQTPEHWLLATKLTDDGKGIVADDPITGKEVVLSYDPSTKTVGGITGIYDAKTKGFVSLADAGGDPPAGSGGPAALQGFVPSTFFAVTVK
jgi:hypothetical protein